ncbi:MAG TPA: type III pantothenate kinase [Flavipsychrobacter sp.]|nr:type III pantothenate kinase [Flavipsychrobacter sp.]
MSLNLCVDWGNSSVKTALFNDETLVDTQTFSHNEAISSLSFYVDDHKPVKSILCSVANHPDGLEKMLQSRTSGYVKLDGRTPLPVMNAYLSQESLGPDRIALATGAHLLYPNKNNLVISLGSCITYNFIQKNKTFRGGAISPGLHMRLRAMHEFTDKLPEVDVDGELLLLGYDTATCMRSGAVLGMACEIDGIVGEYNEQYQDFNAILTGGDAPFFATKLKSKIFADPELLLKGLNLILKHNVPIPR